MVKFNFRDQEQDNETLCSWKISLIHDSTFPTVIVSFPPFLAIYRSYAPINTQNYLSFLPKPLYVDIKKIARTLGIIGPAILISVELFDTSSIVTATASGAAYGYGVLWAAFYSGILLIVIQGVSARLGVVTGKTLAENIHHSYGKTYSLILFAISLFLDFATLTAEVIGLSLAISFIFKIPYPLGVVISILITVILVYFSPYDKLEK
jgi:Mn2+/Fe2+ NRAMP family transporter